MRALHDQNAHLSLGMLQLGRCAAGARGVAETRLGTPTTHLQAAVAQQHGFHAAYSALQVGAGRYAAVPAAFSRIRNSGPDAGQARD
jgi:hypothetical protein